MKLPWLLVAVGVGVILWLGQCASSQRTKALRFEQDAKNALAHANSNQEEADYYKDLAAEAQRRAARIDTVIQYRVRSVHVVDSLFPPDSSCLPNIAARDSLIAAQADDISQLHGVTAAQARALLLLQSSKDELARVLASRPASYPRFLGPNIGLGVFGGVCGLGVPCVGVGVTVNLFSLRL